MRGVLKKLMVIFTKASHSKNLLDVIFVKINNYEEWLETASDNNLTKNEYTNKYKELEEYILPIFKDVM